MPRPRRALSPAFTRLWLAAALTNLGDGALLAATPLLVTTITTDPAAFAAGMFVQQLPWLLFGLAGGALADRLPRAALVTTANATRAVLLAALAAVVATGTPQLWHLYVAGFLLGTVETLADTAYGALVADTVPGELLGRANARLYLTFSLANQLAGPPLGAALFAVGAAIPLGTQVVACVIAALVLARVPSRDQREPGEPTDVRAGLRWLWHHPGLRVLAACILVMNLAGGGVFALWVLYGTEHLGLTTAQYGWFIATGALGCVTGAWVYERLERRLGMTNLLRTGLVVETLTYLALAVTASPWAAAATMAVFGVHAIVWGTAATTARQRATPSRLLGRVGSAYQLASVAGTLIGVALGGLLARQFGLLTPFWCAFGVAAALTAVVWRGLAAVEPSRPVSSCPGR